MMDFPFLLLLHSTFVTIYCDFTLRFDSLHHRMLLISVISKCTGIIVKIVSVSVLLP